MLTQFSSYIKHIFPDRASWLECAAGSPCTFSTGIISRRGPEASFSAVGFSFFRLKDSTIHKITMMKWDMKDFGMVMNYQQGFSESDLCIMVIIGMLNVATTWNRAVIILIIQLIKFVGKKSKSIIYSIIYSEDCIHRKC